MSSYNIVNEAAAKEAMADIHRAIYLLNSIPMCAPVREMFPELLAFSAELKDIAQTWETTYKKYEGNND